MKEPMFFGNAMARSANNAYWDEGEDPDDQEDDVLISAGDPGFDPSKVNTVNSADPVVKTLRYRRK